MDPVPALPHPEAGKQICGFQNIGFRVQGLGYPLVLKPSSKKRVSSSLCIAWQVRQLWFWALGGDRAVEIESQSVFASPRSRMRMMVTMVVVLLTHGDAGDSYDYLPWASAEE